MTDMPSPHHNPEDHVPQDLQETANDIGVGMKLDGKGAFVEYSTAPDRFPAPEKVVYEARKKSENLPEASEEDIRDFYNEFALNADEVIEDLEEIVYGYTCLKDSYSLLYGRYDQLDILQKPEAKRKLIESDERIQKLEAMFVVLKKLAYGTEWFSQIPESRG